MRLDVADVRDTWSAVRWRALLISIAGSGLVNVVAAGVRRTAG